MATPYTFFGNPRREDHNKEVTALTRSVDMVELEKKLEIISTNNESARLLLNSGEKLTDIPIASPATRGLFGALANATPKTAPTNGNVIPLPASKQP